MLIVYKPFLSAHLGHKINQYFKGALIFLTKTWPPRLNWLKLQYIINPKNLHAYQVQSSKIFELHQFETENYPT